MPHTAVRHAFVVALCFVAFTACKQDAGERCTSSDACAAGLACDRFSGTCAPTDHVLALERCRLAPACQSDALCTPSADDCVTASVEDCVQSALCVEDGRCSFEAGACIAKTDADCKQAETCKEDRACQAADGVCVVSVGEGKGPEGGASAKATAKPTRKKRRKKTTAWCRKTDYCLKYGKCTAKGRWCVAATDDDCARSTICKRHGKCSARDGMCAD